MFYVYVIKPELDNIVKIGYRKHPNKRLHQLMYVINQVCDIIDLYVFPNEKDARLFEKDLHVRLSDKRIAGEWFSLG